MRGLAPAPIRVHTGLYSLFCDSTNSQVHRHVAHKKPERQALQRLPKQEMPGLPPTSRPYSPMSPLSPMSGASSPLPGLLSLCIIQNRHHYHVYMHTHKHTHTHTLSLSLSLTHTRTCSHTHTHTHTHTCSTAAGVLSRRCMGVARAGHRLVGLLRLAAARL